MNWLKRCSFLIVLMAPFVVFAGDEKEATDVTGEIVDMSCYISHGARGEKHAKCAKGCASKGLPIGILTESGDLYLLIENHDQADAYATAKEKAAENVTVNGMVFESGGVKAIQVLAVN